MPQTSPTEPVHAAPMGRLRRNGARCLIGAGSATVLIWLTGRVCSDRWVWSQWLLWLPAMTLLPGLALIAGGCALRRTGRWVVVALFAAAILSPFGDVVRLWRPGSMPPKASDHLRILQWTAGPQMKDTARLMRAIEHADPDVVIVLGARQASAGAALAGWGAVPGPMARGEFMIFSAVPVVRCRSLARSDDIQLVELVLETPAPTSILLVDLPSNPGRSRWRIARRTSELIEGTVRTMPNLIVGDFNMTQPSRALRSMLPDWTLAWPAGGDGWGGTWPRQLPLWRIDHVLVPPDSRAPLVTTFDPGGGRHRAQVIDMPL